MRIVPITAQTKLGATVSVNPVVGNDTVLCEVVVSHNHIDQVIIFQQSSTDKKCIELIHLGANLGVFTYGDPKEVVLEEDEIADLTYAILDLLIRYGFDTIQGYRSHTVHLNRFGNDAVLTIPHFGILGNLSVTYTDVKALPWKKLIGVPYNLCVSHGDYVMEACVDGKQMNVVYTAPDGKVIANKDLKHREFGSFESDELAVAIARYADRKKNNDMLFRSFSLYLVVKLMESARTYYQGPTGRWLSNGKNTVELWTPSLTGSACLVTASNSGDMSFEGAPVRGRATVDDLREKQS